MPSPPFSDAAIRRNRERWPYAHLLAATDGTPISETIHSSEAGLREEVETSARRIAAGKELRGKVPGSILVDGFPGDLWYPWAGWDLATYEREITAKLPEGPERRYELRLHPRAFSWISSAAIFKAINTTGQLPDGLVGEAEVVIDSTVPDGGWVIRSRDDGPPVYDTGILRGPRS